MIFFIVTKFWVQSYFFTIILKSFMYNYVYEYQFLPLKLDEAPIELQEMVETYYKGKQEQDLTFFRVKLNSKE